MKLFVLVKGWSFTGGGMSGDLRKAGEGPVQWQAELHRWHMQKKTHCRGRQNIHVTGSTWNELWKKTWGLLKAA